MLDTVVSLRAVGEIVPETDPKGGYIGTIEASAAIETPPPVGARRQMVRLVIRIVTSTPKGQCRLRLWNASGREPKIVDRDGTLGGGATDWDFSQGLNETVELKGSPTDVDGQTLTWSVRFEPLAEASRYDLLVQVEQGGMPLEGATFSYSGPLADYEELSDRFHFAVKT